MLCSHFQSNARSSEADVDSLESNVTHQKTAGVQYMNYVAEAGRHQVRVGQPALNPQLQKTMPSKKLLEKSGT